MLELKNVSTFYGNIQALHGISLHIDRGEIVTLIGANGAGKSTTLMSICGGVPPRSGERSCSRASPFMRSRPTGSCAWASRRCQKGGSFFRK